MSRIYVASSWRNSYFYKVVDSLKAGGHEIFNFRNPREGYAGFHWKEIDPNWQKWTREEYIDKLTTSEISSYGYLSDFRGMQWADTCVLVLPCGRSAHMEAGWFVGANKRLIIFMPEEQEPDLMYLLAQNIVLSVEQLLEIV